MKKSIKSLCLLFILIITSACSLNTYINMEYDNQSYHPLNSSEEFSNILIINISWNEGNIEIKNSNEVENVTIIETTQEQYDEKYLAQVSVDDDLQSLDIKYCDSGVSMIGNYVKALTILIPEDTSLNSIKVNNIYGDTIIKNVNITNVVEVNSTSGAISISNIPVEKIIIQSTSFPVYLKINENNKKVHLNKISGKIIIDIYENIAGFIIYDVPNTIIVTSDFPFYKVDNKFIYSTEEVLSIYIKENSGNLTLNKC